MADPVICPKCGNEYTNQTGDQICPACGWDYTAALKVRSRKRKTRRKAVWWVAGAVTVILVVVVFAPMVYRGLVRRTADKMIEEQPELARLFGAIGGCDPEAARQALASGADPNGIVFGGISCLSHASRSGCAEIVAVLLDHGAEIDHRNGPVGRTALQEATLKGHWAVITLLVERGADVNAENNNGRTALFYSVSPPAPLSLPPDHEKIAEYLRAVGGRM